MFENGYFLFVWRHLEVGIGLVGGDCCEEETALVGGDCGTVGTALVGGDCGKVERGSMGRAVDM